MIIRIEPATHYLTSLHEICACIFVYGDKKSDVCYGWGKSWSLAVKNAVYKFRQVRNSSRIARKKELMDTQKIPAFVNQPNTPIDPKVKKELDAEIIKVRELIHSADRVLLASHVLNINEEAVSKLEESRRNATISLIQLSPKEEKYDY